jgi:hypothetical protein
MFESYRLAAYSLFFLSPLLGNTAERAIIAPTPRASLALQLEIRSQGTTFKNVTMGEMFGENGIKMPFTGYTASDGTGLTAMDPAFESPAKAIEYFETRLAKAQRVTRRGKKRNSHGQIIGERAEATYPYANGAIFTAILWTDGRVFREIDSRSLPLSLKLEQALTP